MALLDWTRMGSMYCLAGVTVRDGQYQVVRPLLARFRDAPVRNVGWSAYQLDGHSRWEIFELIGPMPADPQPPHVEDLWVRSLRCRRLLASPEQRRAILAGTAAKAGEPIFGAPLDSTRLSAYLKPGAGQRSLATLVVPSGQLRFDATRRVGAAEADVRVELPLPHLGNRWLPVKDHHLLCRMEQIADTLEAQLKMLKTAIQQMGDPIAVRLGLSRSFQGDANRGPGMCWLMADGFFSFHDPQP